MPWLLLKLCNHSNYMPLHTLPALTRQKHRHGRGIGSRGAKSGRGQKGQGSRAGSFTKAGFEGGQTPLYMRFPKARGSKQRFTSQITKPGVVSLRHLNRFTANTIVGPEALRNAGLVSWRDKSIKIIGGGELSQKLTVRAHAATASARAAIEAAGGKVEIITKQEYSKLE
jgi:large subunit ribosomal protein L15